MSLSKGKRDRWLTDSEIESVLEALPRMKNQKAADVYLLILASLCRPGEAAGIKAEDITLNGERVWKVADPKNGKKLPKRCSTTRKRTWKEALRVWHEKLQAIREQAALRAA